MASKPLYILFPLFISSLLLFSCNTQPTQAEDEDLSNGENLFSHTEEPGGAAADFLKEDRFSELLVEIQYMPGYRPEDGALDELRVFLEGYLNKVITIPEPQQIPGGEQEQYSANEIRDLEEQHRQHFSEENTLASYNLFVDGGFETQNVLGIAYYNTSNAYFGKTIGDVSGSPPLSPSKDKVEGTVLRHEYGHLLGLVDNGTDMLEEHRQNGAHCSEEECVMYASVNTTDFFANLFDGIIPDLGDFCLADIQAVQVE